MKKTTKAPKQTIADATRVNAFRLSPEALVNSVKIVGRDTPHKLGEHPLSDKRAFKKPRRDVINSMKVHGWKGGVITLRKDGDQFLVVDGRGRVMAAREANHELEFEGSEMRICPIALVEKAEDGDVATTMAVMNSMREEEDILEKGRKALQMLKFGKSMPEVAAAFGVSVTSVEQWIKVPADCAPEILDAIERKEVAGSVALELAALPRDQQIEKFEQLKTEGKLTVAAAKETVRKVKTENGTAKKFPLAAVRKICKLAKNEKLSAELDPLVLKVFQCLIGEADPRKIKGLSAALREAGFGPKEEKGDETEGETEEAAE